MDGMKTLIADAVAEIVRSQVRHTEYRSPLVGFADARNPLFDHLKTLIAPDHLLPTDLLPEAETVVSFFLPFTKELVRQNQDGPVTAPAWATAKQETDEVIDAVIQGVKERIAVHGIAGSANPALERYDPVRFIHRWSQRHVAYLCGLGNFGLNQLIITSRGCAGRLGSLCISAPIDPDPICTEEVCPYKIDGSCGVCVRKCPAKALEHGTIDKPACSAWINAYTEKYFNGDRAFRSCGKCIALPCALRRPGRDGGRRQASSV
jgi:epoxyqueuosine reductase QueG